MKYKTAAAVMVISAQLAACATAPERIDATYVSPNIYADYDCTQVSIEMQRTSYKLFEITRKQDKKAENDQGAVAIGLLMFPPALLALAVGSDHKKELQSLKGTYDALNEAAIQKQCTFVGHSPRPTPAFAPKVQSETRPGPNSNLVPATAPPVQSEAQPAPAPKMEITSTTSASPIAPRPASNAVSSVAPRQDAIAPSPKQVERSAKEQDRRCIQYAFRVVGDPAQDQCAVWAN